MARLCGRPGCSEPGAVAYGMVAEDAVFWMSTIAEAPTADPSVLCRRHADAMIVPRGWTLDDRREPMLRLFQPRPVGDAARPARRSRRRTGPVGARPEQLQIDGTGEIERPALDEPPGEADPSSVEAAGAWEPEFDHDDDLGGLLEVSSPLLARAFRGSGRPRA